MALNNTPADKQASHDVESLDDLLDDFILELDAASSTKYVYRRAVVPFIHWSEGMPLVKATVKLYKEYLLNKKCSANTVSTYLSATKQFLSYLVDKGIIMTNPADTIKRPRIPKHHLRDALTKREAKRLLNSIPRESLMGLRDYAMMNLMLRTALREVELARSLLSDIVKKCGRRVLLVHGKGKDGKDEFAVLTKEAYQPLLVYLRKRKPVSSDEPLFSRIGGNPDRPISTRRIRRIITVHLIAAGLKTKRITPHSLKHTAITLAIRGGQGKNILQVQQMARHASISTTLKYFHEFDRMKNAAEFSIDL